MWDTGCVGRVGPIKDSLTYHPSSQGWAPRVLLLSMCSVLLSVLFVCTWVGVEVVAFLLFLLQLGCYKHVFFMYLSLPKVDDVAFFPVHKVGVEDDVRVSTKELAIHLGVHGSHLKVLNTPHLHKHNKGEKRSTVDRAACCRLFQQALVCVTEQ